MDIDIILILTGVAMLAGCIDAIAGGGGLLTLPAILLTGVSPVSAIATNKLQATAASFSSTIAFARRGLVDWKRGIFIAFASFTGGAFGAISASLIPSQILQALVPILLICVAIYFIFSPKLDHKARPPKVPFWIFSSVITPMLGFYDGIFGPGTGSFFLIAFILLLGKDLLKAMAQTKLANFSCNLGSLIIFLIHGHVIFSVAICMAVGAFIGAQIGARFAIRFGSKLVKPLLITISTIMAIKLLTDPNNPIYQLVTSKFF